MLLIKIMTRWSTAFVNQPRNNNDYYNLFDDYYLIESSFAQQYGIRLRQEDSMTWDEFCSLLSGLNGETPLGNVVRIRSETDRKKIREFSKHEKKIYDDWHRKHMTRPTGSVEDGQNALRQIFGV